MNVVSTLLIIITLLIVRIILCVWGSYVLILTQIYIANSAEGGELLDLKSNLRIGLSCKWLWEKISSLQRLSSLFRPLKTWMSLILADMNTRPKRVKLLTTVIINSNKNFQTWLLLLLLLLWLFLLHEK